MMSQALILLEASLASKLALDAHCPGLVSAYINLAKVYERQGDRKQLVRAVEFYHKALELPCLAKHFCEEKFISTSMLWALM